MCPPFSLLFFSAHFPNFHGSVFQLADLLFCTVYPTTDCF